MEHSIINNSEIQENLKKLKSNFKRGSSKELKQKELYNYILSHPMVDPHEFDVIFKQMQECDLFNSKYNIYLGQWLSFNGMHKGYQVNHYQAPITTRLAYSTGTDPFDTPGTTGKAFTIEFKKSWFNRLKDYLRDVFNK